MRTLGVNIYIRTTTRTHVPTLHSHCHGDSSPGVAHSNAVFQELVHSAGVVEFIRTSWMIRQYSVNINSR